MAPELRELVRAMLAEYGQTQTEAYILEAHSGRLDTAGRMINPGNLRFLRLYRNQVTANPKAMINDATADE